MKVLTGLSNHHVHLTKEAGETLFGPNYDLTVKRPLRQVGEYACEEVVDIEKNGKRIEHVRIIGPYRKYTQVELLHSDCEFFGIEDIRRNSGELNNTHTIKIIGPMGEYVAHNSGIVAINHVHLSPEEAINVGVKDKELVDIKLDDGRIIHDIVVKSADNCLSEFHINKDEATPYNLENGMEVELCLKLKM